MPEHWKETVEDIQVDKSTVIKYLKFLADFVEDLLVKSSTLVQDDLQRLFNEHALFVRRVEKSRRVSDDFKIAVRDLAVDPLIFGEGVAAKIGETIEIWEGGPHRNDRTSYGPFGPRVIEGLCTYRDRLQSLLQRIDTFRFSR